MITVFTPTFNRAKYLPQLYNSLKQQTDKEFEWIIVDDGSTDNTKELIEEWILENNCFPIYYYYQNNSGKHVAINRGVNQSNSDWFFIVDSDDYITNNAVEWINHTIKNINDTPQLAGISGTKITHSGDLIGQIPQVESGGYIVAKNTERKKKKLRGDKAEVYKTEVLKKYPFPHFEGEKFISEYAVWDLIAYSGYYLYWYNKPLMVCEYLPFGLTNSKNLELNNFNGFTYCQKLLIDKGSFYTRSLALGRFAYYAEIKGLNSNDACEMIHCRKIALLITRFIYKIRRKFF